MMDSSQGEQEETAIILQSVSGASSRTEAPSSKGREPKTYRFNPGRDIILLKEVLAKNPWGSNVKSFKEGMEVVVSKLNNPSLKYSTVRDLLNFLLDKFKDDQMESLRKSGTEEEYDKREQLLQDIFDLKSSKEDADAEKI